MFLPENNRKMVNISVVTLKRNNRRYELAVYPNKLYEFHNNSNIDLSTILHTFDIYCSISTGEKASWDSLEELKDEIKSKTAIHKEESSLQVLSKAQEMCDKQFEKCSENEHLNLIKYILKNGHERKHLETKTYELQQIEKSIIDIVQHKVKYNGSFLSKELLLKYIKSVWRINLTEPKKQVGGIIKNLEEIGFERISYKIRVNKNDIPILSELFSKCIAKDLSDFILVKSDILPDFVNYCNRSNIKFVIMKDVEEESEDIC